jgi:rubrerythrin
MSQLSVSHRITKEVRDESMKHLREIENLLQRVSPGNTVTDDFAVAIMTALSEVTIGFMTAERKKARKYAEMGFVALMKSLS